MSLLSEIWRPIPGFDGYEASSLGRIRSPNFVWRHGKRVPHQGRVLKQTAASRHKRLRVPIGGHQRYVSRLVLMAFEGPPPPGTECCHNNGDITDNTLTNLRWDTRSSNTRDQVLHGTHPMARRVVCPLEHALMAPNLASGNTRACLACKRTRHAQGVAQKRGELGSFDFRATADRCYQNIIANPPRRRIKRPVLNRPLSTDPGPLVTMSARGALDALQTG